MAMNTSKLLSGRVPVTSYDNLSPDRYQFLGLSQAEPNLGAPVDSGSLLTSTSTGTRSWSNVISVDSNIVTFYSQYNFPQVDGTASQVLYTDGNGNLRFATVPPGRQLVNGNSSVIVILDGNVNISSAGNANVLVVTGTGANVTGTFDVTSNANVGNLGTAQVLATANVTAPQLISNVATGTSPFLVSSNTVVANLNADLLDGYNTATSNTANTVAVRDANGNLSANFFIGNGSQLTGLTTSSISNGNSNVNIPAANGNVNISAAGNANVLVITGTGANVTGILDVAGNIANANVISANSLVSTAGCVTISQAVIAVSGNNAGIFSSLIDDINFGLAANVVMGAVTGNVTVQGTLNAANISSSGNINSTGTISAQSIRVGDLYSNRLPVAVTANTVIDSFNTSEFRSAKYTIRATNDLGYQALEVLLIHDNINSIITVYGTLSTTGSDIITLESIVDTGVVELTATGLGANTTVNLLGTYVPD